MISHDFTHLLLQCCKCPDKEVEDGGWEGLLEGEHAGSGIARELDKVDEVAKSLLNGACRKEQFIDHRFSPLMEVLHVHPSSHSVLRPS